MHIKHKQSRNRGKLTLETLLVRSMRTGRLYHLFKLNLLTVPAHRIGIQSSRENGKALKKAARCNGKNNAEIAKKRIKTDAKRQHMKFRLRLQTFMKVKILTENKIKDVQV